MEILLLEDVAGIGKKNDLLVVGDGFALNFLLPARKALVATPTVRKRYADQIKKRAEEKERDRQTQQQASEALKGKSVTFTRKAAKNGKLYDSIHEADIIAAVSEQHNVTVAKNAVELTEHIKTVGTHSVQLKLGDGTISLPVVVNAEK